MSSASTSHSSTTAQGRVGSGSTTGSGTRGASTPDYGWLVADIAAAVAWPAATAMLTHQTVLVSGFADVHLPAPDARRRRTARIETPSSFVHASPVALADGIVAALQPVVEAVHSRTRWGRHALWGTVTDMVAAAFHRVGDHLGQSSEARQTPGGDLCLTCPRITDQHRRDLLEQSALVRLASAADGQAWADRIERGLVRVSTVTRLEIGHSARTGDDLRAGLRRPPLASMPVEYLTPAVENRAVEVQQLLADRGHHRGPAVRDLLIAATAELAGLAVLHLDKDFDLIADVTGQQVERLPLDE